MRYKKTFSVARDAKSALDYIADFTKLTEWEPSVRSVVQTQGHGPGPDAVYDITMRFMGQTSQMRYTCTEYSSRHAVLLGEGDGFSGYDRIDVQVTKIGSEVSYLTDIKLLTSKGRLLAPFISLIFGFNVRHAVKNLCLRLN